jgi:hypothetical protein
VLLNVNGVTRLPARTGTVWICVPDEVEPAAAVALEQLDLDAVRIATVADTDSDLSSLADSDRLRRVEAGDAHVVRRDARDLCGAGGAAVARRDS